MNIFLLDRSLKVKKVLASKGDVGNISPFFNDLYTQYLETGAETFEFEINDNGEVEICSYVAFRYNNEYKLLQISSIEDTHEETINKKIYSETAGLELIGEVVRPREIPNANFSQLLTILLNNTGWQVGNVSDDITDVHTINIEKPESIYSFMQEMLIKYGCEISFRVDIKNNKVVGKYIDVYKQRGRITNKRFEYSRNLSGASKKEDSFSLATSLIGYGKDGLTFKDAEWSVDKGSPCDKPLNQDFVMDEESYLMWNNNGSHITGVFECEAESPYELLKLTWAELQKRKNPKLDYEVDVKLFDNDLGMGDQVYIIDREYVNPLFLSARVNELHISFTDNSKNKAVFSNYKKVTPNSNTVAYMVDKLSRVTNNKVDNSQEAVFSALVNNNSDNGLYLEDGKVLVNGKYLKGQTLEGNTIISQNELGDTTTIQGGYVDVVGTAERSWLGQSQGSQTIRLKSEKGKFRARNETLNRSVFFSDNGLSTTADGTMASEGILDFFSNWYNYSYKGIALYSNRHVGIISNLGYVNISPEWSNKGNNTFSFQVVNGATSSDTDGLLCYGSHVSTNFSSRLRFAKDNANPFVRVEDGLGNPCPISASEFRVLSSYSSTFSSIDPFEELSLFGDNSYSKTVEDLGIEVDVSKENKVQSDAILILKDIIDKQQDIIESLECRLKNIENILG